MVAVKLSGGAKMESFLRKMSEKIDTAASVDVGFMGDATEADGTPVALVAALNEFGVPKHNQPPRPFFRIAIAKDSRKWGKNLGVALEDHDYNAAVALELVGINIKESIEDSIRRLVSPPLADVTIAKKGFSKPLIETSTMLNSVTFKVNKG